MGPACGIENYILHFCVIWGYHVQHLITQKYIRKKRNACSFEKVNKKSLICYQINEHKLVSKKIRQTILDAFII